MSKKTNTRRAFFTSVISLLLCVVMLVGSTFAWFTDNASTAVNTIQAGTLDIQLLDDKGNNLEGKTLSFTKAGDNELWEPGQTWTLPTVYIKNEGNLAVKYKVEITGIKGDAKLNEVIDWTISTGIEDGATEGHLSANAQKEITISGTMVPTAGNEYQGLTIDGIGITVQATQDTVEYDSNNNRYDANATYDTLVNVHDQEELKAALDNATEPVTLVLADGTYTLSNFSGKTVTFSGTKDTVINMSTAVQLPNCDVTFDGVTIEFGSNAQYTGFQHTNKQVFKDCTIKGQMFLYAPNNTFIDCTFENSGDNYNVWTYGTNASFTNCTFNCDGKAVLIYTESAVTASYTFTDCTFTDKGNISGKAAIEVAESAYSNEANYTIHVNRCTVNGFDVTGQNASTFGGTNLGTTVWGNKNLIPADRLNVFINGDEVY